MEALNDDSAKQIKILFLCWGYSIHAYRRIKLFIDDNRFKVSIVSNYDYNFENAGNYYLNAEQNLQTAHLKREQTGIFFVYKERFLQKQNIKKIIDIIQLLISLLKIQLILLPKKFLKIIDIKKILPEIRMGINDYNVLKLAVNNCKPDVIFLQTLLYPCYLAYFLPYTIPQIITFWNGDIIWWAKWNGIDSLIKKQIVTYGARRAKAITVNSKLAVDMCKTVYGISEDKIIRLHYPGVDLDHFRPIDKDNAKRALTLKEKHIILWPRGLGGYLNSDILIQSSAAVVQKYPDVLFLVISGVGGEAEKNYHFNLARELGVEKHFIFKGHVSYEDMPLYYGCSDAVVSISSNDSLPNVMIEAMACGVPLIMGDIPQISDWITKGYNGYLVPLRDPDALSNGIMTLLGDLEHNNKLFIKRNIELVKREFDSKKNIEKIKESVIQIFKKNS